MQAVPDAVTSVVVAPEELDLATAPEFRSDLDLAFATGVEVVVADMGGTTFCDSSGLKVLVHAAVHARRSGQCFALRGTSAALRRTIDIVGATSLLGLADEQQSSVGGVRTVDGG